MLGINLPCSATQMEGKPWPHPPRPSPPLLEIGLARPHRGVVGHVVVRREQLHLGLAAVDHVDNVVDGHGRLSNVGRQDDLERHCE
mgnify:CR=1 FL=1